MNRSEEIDWQSYMNQVKQLTPLRGHTKRHRDGGTDDGTVLAICGLSAAIICHVILLKAPGWRDRPSAVPPGHNLAHLDPSFVMGSMGSGCVVVVLLTDVNDNAPHIVDDLLADSDQVPAGRFNSSLTNTDADDVFLCHTFYFCKWHWDGMGMF